MVESGVAKPSRAFWIIGVVALVWNLIGVVSYLLTVTMSAEALAKMSEADQTLYANTPAWVTGAYAISVFAGALACIALLLRKSWAIPLFLISLVAVLAQTLYSLLLSKMIELRGPGGAVLPVLITLIAVYLVHYSRSAKKKGWL